MSPKSSLKKTATVIIPTYNERENVQKVIPALLDVFSQIKSWKMQILVVDDTSPDKTYEVVEKLAKKHKEVHLLINGRKAGLGGAYLKGMEEAFGKLKSDVVFEFDADLSHDATKIPDFLASIENGSDMVLGSRYIDGGGIPDNWGLHRKFLSVVGNLTIAVVLTNFSIRDWTTGFRAITREVYEKVKPHVMSERFFGYTFQIGFLNTAIKQGFMVSEVPFKFIDRTIGQSKLGPEYIINTLRYIFKMRILEILQSKVFKFLVVGGIGTLVQLTTLAIYRRLLPDFEVLQFLTTFFVATAMSIESAIVSNFILNNAWTFAKEKIALAQVPVKFIQFNVASLGSVGIQLLVAWIGETFFGLFELFTIPIVNIPYDTGTLYAMIGIVIGLFWNFFAYTRFIWKKK